MKTITIFILMLAAGLVSMGIATAQTAADRAVIGVRVDPQPLNELLAKHLRLGPDQGLLIRNVQKDSPADQAGLERDDIIVAFEGHDVFSYEEFVSDVQSRGIGADVNLDVIHEGQRQTVTLTLAAASSDVEWKYPQDVDSSHHWRPGRVFRFQPDQKQWQAMPFDQMPDIQNEVKKFFNERYSYYHSSDGGQDYEIIIEGAPDNPDTAITVRIDKTEYNTTVGEIDALPEEYRQAARDALENARQSSTWQGGLDIRIPPPGGFNDDFFQSPFPQPPGGHFYTPSDDSWQRMHEQMEDMRRRMQEMERRHQELFEQYNQTPNTQPSESDTSEKL
ncbi:MAG: PDZ domain-containing protein [Sedimentisphaerales bacterium]|nr:PDZ domain-containing protein [Sedimentisphaerales bacterium]